ncbi:site-specific integrase [Novosphingobium sp. AP12]|uniref:site-specific integrase n=1 Tax=Novosphingobium sp. AP12 TaxID=1144305 RepID=UPI0002721079|nr:site-specific integrase [Novosphingobium sp. AP12]EJL22428.1 site-specific recombinase XerD [Novosphingobium sp. AP12]
MRATKRRVPGFEYLYSRGRSYEVRLQVPRPVRGIVGKGELKRSLGGDFAKAKASYHSVVVRLQEVINAARREANQAPPTTNTSLREPSQDEINAASYRHFRLTVENMRGKNWSPTGESATKRSERIEAAREMLEFLLDRAEHEQWGAMAAQASWLCKDMGWSLNSEGGAFEYLCQTMMRARIQALKNEIRRLKGRFGGDPEADPLFGQTPPTPEEKGMTLAELVERFKAAKDQNWSASTRKNYAIIFRVIDEVCGGGTRLDLIDHDYCVSVWQTFRRLPSNFQKHPATRGKAIVDAITIAEEMGHPTISPSTINGHLSKLAAIVRYGRDKGWISGNPMDGIEERDPVPASEKRDAFDDDQLSVIFESEPWKSGPLASVDKPSRYWAPLIALYSGARLSEICGQRVDEMIEERGIKAFHFRLRPNDRSIKSGSSRKVPVHPELIRLGFWRYVEEARRSKRDMLFPDVSRDKLGKWGDSTSKWFARLIDRLELQGTALSFHSFRHTFENALKEADLHDTPVGNKITGRWSAGVSKNYGSEFTLRKLALAMEKIEFPHLQLPAPSAPITMEV